MFCVSVKQWECFPLELREKVNEERSFYVTSSQQNNQEAVSDKTNHICLLHGTQALCVLIMDWTEQLLSNNNSLRDFSNSNILLIGAHTLDFILTALI